MESNECDAARDALDAISHARAAAADRLVTPWWYHPVVGLLFGGYFVLLILGGTTGVIIAVPLFLASLAFLRFAYKKRTGVWISGMVAGRLNRWSISLGVVVLAVVGAAYVMHDASGVVWPVWVAAAVTIVAVNVFGQIFDRRLRAKLRADAHE